jgi:hypothetical protein
MKSDTEAAASDMYADKVEFEEQNHARSQDEADMIRMGKAQQTKVRMGSLVHRRLLTETAQLRPRAHAWIHNNHVMLLGICVPVRCCLLTLIEADQTASS